MASTIKAGLRTGFKNWITLLFFIITYKIIGFTLVLDFIQKLKSAILHILGLSFIGQQNVGLIVKNPFAVLLLACILFVFSYYVYLEIVALFFYCEIGWKGGKISVWQLWKNALLRSFSFFHLKNLPVVIGMIPLIGLSVFPLTYGFMGKLQVPEFILDYIKSSPKLHFLFVICILFLNILTFFYLFSLPGIIVEKKCSHTSLRSGMRFLKGKVIKTAATLVCFVFLFLLLSLVFSTGAILLLWACSKIPPSPDGGKSFFRFYFIRWGSIGNLFFSALLPVSLYAPVVVLYHRYRGDTAPEAKKAIWTPKRILTRIAAVLASFVFLGFFIETELGGNLYSADKPGTEIVAHRAGATFAPENTLAALKDSIEAGAEMAEIDVQQTQDGVLIIMHDSNFLRTSGLNQAVWETDFATVETLDAGSHFSSSFAGEKIPTLEEMLKEAKGQIRLMIELKSTGHEHGLVEQTIQKIQAAGMEAECMIASMDIELLQRSKRLAPEIETVYISTLTIAKEYNLDYVDGYSVETSFLNLEMVSKVQSAHKKIYAWTANSETNIGKIIRLGADGLITDNPRLANYSLMFYDKRHLLDDLTGLLYS